MLPAGTGNRSNEANNLELSYSLGLGGGSSRAVTSWVKPVRAWEPSQKGLLADWPQRQSEITVRPASPKAAPEGSRISKSPSIRMGPLLKTETLVGIIDGSTGVGEGRRTAECRQKNQQARPAFRPA